MEIITKIKATWLTRKVAASTLPKTLLTMLFVVIGSALYINNFFHAENWMPASYDLAINQKQYWRLWTTLLAHSDFSHIGSNLILFFPFAYYLIGHFGLKLFPFIGFIVGGLINLIVLSTMPEKTTLIGFSGVVHWMGAVWMTLAFFIDTPPKLSKRILKFFGVSIILFIPDTLKPNVSYLCHFVGFMLGILSGCLYYLINRKQFKNAEVLEYIIEDDDVFYDENLQGTDYMAVNE